MIHLMSVLGTSNYSETTYYLGKFSKIADISGTNPEDLYTGRFVQIASLTKILKEHPGEKVKVSIFLTKKAKDQNWKSCDLETRVNPDDELKIMLEQISSKYAEQHPGITLGLDVREIRHLNGLEEVLKEFITGYEEHHTGAVIDVETIDIPVGKNKEEQDSIFDSLYDSISEKETIYFDVTHGFRSIPILAMTILNYARVVKKIKVGGIYYGAFEASSDGIVPIFDMTYCDNVMQWTEAAGTFISSGSSNRLKEVCRNIYGNGGSSIIRNVVESLYNLTNCLETSRGHYSSSQNPRNQNPSDTVKNSIKRAYGQFVINYNNMRNRNVHADEAALRNLFEVISDDIKVFQDEVIANNSNNAQLAKISIGIAAVRWAIKKNLTQQGLTALEATIATYVGETCPSLNVRLNSYQGMEDISQALRNGPNCNANIRQTIQQAIPEPYFSKLSNCCTDTKKARNSINHFGVTDRPGDQRTYDQLNRILKDQYKILLECVNNNCKSNNANQNIYPDWMP